MLPSAKARSGPIGVGRPVAARRATRARLVFLSVIGEAESRGGLEREGPPERASRSNWGQTYACYGNNSVWGIAGTESTEGSTKGTKRVVSISVPSGAVVVLGSVATVASMAFLVHLSSAFATRAPSM